MNGDPTDSSPLDDDVTGSVTMLLARWGRGDRTAAEELFPLVYEDLRRIALRYSRREDQTLQPTAVVHEAYLRIAQSDASFEGRKQFLGFASRVMRSVMVDHVRAAQRDKRGGGWRQITWTEAVAGGREQSTDVFLRLEEALSRLEALDERKCRLVELRYFGGLSYEESGEVLGLSKTTVNRELRLAKAWLRAELEGASSDF